MSAVETIAAFVPAFIANGAATLVHRGTPIDMGRRFIDGRRLLGDGKTIEGSILAILYGVSVALLLARLDAAPLYALLATPVGAVLGDMAGSFVKRRLGLERGAKAPVLDQLDFVVGAYLALLAAGYTPNPLATLGVAAAAFVLHRVTNIAAYKLGIKTVPW